MTRKIFIRFFKLVKTVFLVFVSLIVIYFIAALILSVVKTRPPVQDCNEKKELFITTNGVHLDIIIPMELLNPDFSRNLETLPGTKYVSFGWGDRNFYINTPEWKDLTFPTAFNALFLKSKTAMHVTCLQQKYSGWEPFYLCPERLGDLHFYIENSFLRNENGTFIKIPVQGYYGFDFFYEAKGSFSLFKTCNVWVNNALKTAGFETSVWSPFDWGVLYHLSE